MGITSDPLVETAQQTDQENFSTSLGASYQISSDLSAELTLNQDLHSSQGTSQAIANSVGSSSDWSLSGSLNYQLGPGVSTGLGAGFGYNKVEVGPDMTYENLNLQINWQIGRKLSLSLNGGAQIRQFLGSGQPSLISPTFGVAFNYQALNFIPSSRFTIINADRMDAHVAIGGQQDGKHVIEEYRAGQHPVFAVIHDLTEVIRRYAN